MPRALNTINGVKVASDPADVQERLSMLADARGMHGGFMSYGYLDHVELHTAKAVREGPKAPSSKYTGVGWGKGKGKWKVQYKGIAIRYHDDKVEAARMYNNAAHYAMVA